MSLIANKLVICIVKSFLEHWIRFVALKEHIAECRIESLNGTAGNIKKCWKKRLKCEKCSNNVDSLDKLKS